MEEIFKPVLNYEGLYEVSNQGVIRNVKTGKTLKPACNYKGYPVVSLYKDGEPRSFLVHRIVWMAFFGSIPNNLQINHINEVKTDNRLENLECVTAAENIRWSKAKIFGCPRKRKPVVCIDSSGNIAGYWDTRTQAGEVFRPNNPESGSANIDAAIKVNGTAYGYRWRYFDDLPPVTKLAVVAFENTLKNKAKQ
jgi:hypothetical protein